MIRLLHCHSNKTCNFRNGFTLLELILVMSIGIVLATASLVSLSGSRARREFQNTGSDIVSMLHEAVGNARTQRDGVAWGVYFDMTTERHFYALFSGTSYALSTERERRTLPSAIDFISLPGGVSTTSIAFAQITGEPVGGEATVRIQSSNSNTGTVTVFQSGNIEYSEP